MKIKVEFTVDVDAEAWSHEYGVEKAEVREDVKMQAANTVKGHFDNLGLLGKWTP